MALCPTFERRLVSSGDDLTVVLSDARTGERLLEFSSLREITGHLSGYESGKSSWVPSFRGLELELHS